LEKYSELEPSVEFLHTFSGQDNLVDLAGRIVYNEKKEPVFNFGKHKGRTVVEVLKKEPSYYEWMMNSDFALQTKKVLTRLRLQMMSGKPQ
jgi:DNA polymerase-3 subunit epsilon